MSTVMPARLIWNNPTPPARSAPQRSDRYRTIVSDHDGSLIVECDPFGGGWQARFFWNATLTSISIACTETRQEAEEAALLWYAALVNRRLNGGAA